LSGWIRRTSADNVLSNRYYIGALLWTFNNDTIRAEDGGWCYYYFIKGEPGNELSN